MNGSLDEFYPSGILSQVVKNNLLGTAWVLGWFIRAFCPLVLFSDRFIGS